MDVMLPSASTTAARRVLHGPERAGRLLAACRGSGAAIQLLLRSEPVWLHVAGLSVALWLWLAKQGTPLQAVV